MTKKEFIDGKKFSDDNSNEYSFQGFSKPTDPLLGYLEKNDTYFCSTELITDTHYHGYFYFFGKRYAVTLNFKKL